LTHDLPVGSKKRLRIERRAIFPTHLVKDVVNQFSTELSHDKEVQLDRKFLVARF